MTTTKKICIMPNACVVYARTNYGKVHKAEPENLVGNLRGMSRSCWEALGGVFRISCKDQ